MKNKKDNFLDYIPVISSEITWDISDDTVVVDISNKGFYNWIAQKFFKRPKISHIKLDEYGSFIWRHIDGINTIYIISDKLKAEFGEDAEPLYNRIIQYFRILKNNGFIVYKKRRNS